MPDKNNTNPAQNASISVLFDKFLFEVRLIRLAPAFTENHQEYAVRPRSGLFLSGIVDIRINMEPKSPRRKSIRRGLSGNKVFCFQSKTRHEAWFKHCKRINLRSFHFAALQTTSAYVLRSNNAIVYNSDLLYVCIVRAWCLTVTVAHFIAGQFRFPANAANSRHISHLQIQIQI